MEPNSEKCEAKGKVKCGVYLIRNTTDGKVYVGSSMNVAKRWQSHVNLLKANKHSNLHLQRAWLRDGQDAFEFSIIEICPEGALIVREVVWVEYHGSLNHDKGYNLEYPDRRGHSEETKQKISASHVGNPKCLGKKHSEEFKKRLSEIHKGNQYRKGQFPSEETKRKMSESHKGLLKGKILSAEHRAKLSAAHKGKKRPDEFRKKMSEVTKKSWLKRHQETPHVERNRVPV